MSVVDFKKINKKLNKLRQKNNNVMSKLIMNFFYAFSSLIDHRNNDRKLNFTNIDRLNLPSNKLRNLVSMPEEFDDECANNRSGAADKDLFHATTITNEKKEKLTFLNKGLLMTKPSALNSSTHTTSSSSSPSSTSSSSALNSSNDASTSNNQQLTLDTHAKNAYGSKSIYHQHHQSLIVSPDENSKAKKLLQRI
jgi:hypothetical protein